MNETATIKNQFGGSDLFAQFPTWAKQLIGRNLGFSCVVPKVIASKTPYTHYSIRSDNPSRLQIVSTWVLEGSEDYGHHAAQRWFDKLTAAYENKRNLLGFESYADDRNDTYVRYVSEGQFQGWHFTQCEDLS